MAKKNKKKKIELHYEWNIPDDIVARYATNMVVQRTEHEFIISFFEVKPPLFLGSPEEIIEQTKKLDSVRANCVAQVIVAADKMPSFIEDLETNLKRSQGPNEDNGESK